LPRRAPSPSPGRNIYHRFEAAALDKRRAGLSREDAARAAQLQLGSAAAVKDHARDAGWETIVEQFGRDIAYAWRGMWRSRSFVATTVLTLAVGLGLVTVVFTVFDAYVLRPFSIRDPQNSNLELPPEGSHHARALCAEPGMGHRGDANQGNPPDGQQEQVEDPRVDRARIRRTGGIGCGEGSEEMRRLLPHRPDGDLDGQQVVPLARESRNAS
jgi:hypothetical protein